MREGKKGEEEEKGRNGMDGERKTGGGKMTHLRRTERGRQTLI